jgi:hypothetical protein
LKKIAGKLKLEETRKIAVYTWMIDGYSQRRGEYGGRGLQKSR